MRSRTLVIRRAAVVAAGAVLTLSAAALPADAGQTSASTTATVSAAKPSLSISGSATSVKAWQQFVLKGRATGTPAGTKVVVERYQSGKWVTFPASTVVTRSGSYSVRVQSGRVGAQSFRVGTSKAASKAVKVTVWR
jgi:hypothetical protein